MTRAPLEATCHCGSVRLEADELPATVTSCNCSICRRYGALWAYFTRASARVTHGANMLEAYSWGDRTIEFFHCRNCGCLTHYESAEGVAQQRVVINARMLTPERLATIPIRRFDGADSWRFLD